MDRSSKFHVEPGYEALHATYSRFIRVRTITELLKNNTL